jgi:hypothetical protein
MCTGGDGMPANVAEALRMADAALGFLREPGAASLLPAELGGVLEAVGAWPGCWACRAPPSCTRRGWPPWRASTATWTDSMPRWQRATRWLPRWSPATLTWRWWTR